MKRLTNKTICLPRAGLVCSIRDDCLSMSLKGQSLKFSQHFFQTPKCFWPLNLCVLSVIIIRNNKHSLYQKLHLINYLVF